MASSVTLRTPPESCWAAMVSGVSAKTRYASEAARKLKATGTPASRRMANPSRRTVSAISRLPRLPDIGCKVAGRLQRSHQRGECHGYSRPDDGHRIESPRDLEGDDLLWPLHLGGKDRVPPDDDDTEADYQRRHQSEE